MAKAGREVLVAGVGMIPFTKPGASASYDAMGSEAIQRALSDAGISYSLIEQAYAGFVYGKSCSGQRVVYKAGMTGIPVFNVNNNCSSGATALFLARQAVESGSVECALAVGFEEMNPGALGMTPGDRVNPLADFDTAYTEMVADIEVPPGLPPTLRYYGALGLMHMKKYGTTLKDFAAVRAKASRHAAKNPLAIFRKEITTQDVLDAQVLWPGAMTRLMACPPSCGAAAAVLVSRDFARRHNLDPKVRIAAQAMTTDTSATFRDMIHLLGSDVVARAARAVYEAAGIGPDDIRVVELHDCFVQNEVITYEALGLCREGASAQFIADEDNTYGGRHVVNPSGGLLSKGHPLGATGLAQCYELTHQLRGTAEARQVEDVRHGLQQNMGLGGACVVTLYEQV